jgi:predicted AAA+ superfamily ATPase
MHGLTEAEILSRVGPGRPSFLERLRREDPSLLDSVTGRPDIVDYIGLAVRGGFPEVALGGWSEDQALTWLDSYLGELLTRDLDLDPRRDTGKMRKYFEALSLNSAGLPQEVTLGAAAGVSVKTATAYDELFEALFVTERVPAWSDSRLKRLIKSPKRYVVDPALAAAAAGLTTDSILADPDLMGRILDTFGTAQLRPEVALGSRMRLHHLRTKGGREEVDLVIEVGGGQIIAIEFKAAAAPSTDDARHLAWLRDSIGDRFLAGALLHAGPDAFRLADRLFAIPICVIWE